MLKQKKRSIKPPGLPPGAVVFTGSQRSGKVSLSVIRYAEQKMEEVERPGLEVLSAVGDEKWVHWINIDGVHDEELIKEIGRQIHLHPLLMEDLANLNQRPKLDEYEDHLFITLKMITYSEGELVAEQLGLVVGKDFVLSFQEYPGDVFEPIRSRLRNEQGRIRKMGADYLAYALMDTIVDHYFIVMEELGEQVDFLEEELLQAPQKQHLVRINALKRQVIQLRKSVWPLREIVNSLQRDETGLIRKKTQVFLSDLYDHTIHVIEMIEVFRDTLASLTDLYMSSLSQKMNEVMQFLTIIGALFIPLTFIAGVYGMNFARMPELQWTYGYPLVMGCMGLMVVGLLVYFKRKKWL